MLNFFGAKKKPVSTVRSTELRVDTSVGAEWRFKPVGKIASPWSRVVVNELSRSNAIMTTDRALKLQDAIEIRAVLDGQHPSTFDAAVVRCDQTGAKFKVALAFKHVDEEHSHVITRFLNKRMTELRSRGLV